MACTKNADAPAPCDTNKCEPDPEMEGVQFDATTKTLSLVTRPVPKLGAPDDVIVQVAYAGVCGTDLHIVEGHFPCSPEPVIMGHEFCGVAVEVGPQVTHIKKGDRVAVDPNRGCNNCSNCSNGRPHYCSRGMTTNVLGIWRDGGWSQFCLTPASQVYLLPDKVTLEQAALTEPLSCIAHGWDRVAPIPVGSHILVQGAGIIGNLWACVLHLQGHKQVIVSEPQPARRELFGRLETGYACVSPEELRTASHKSDADWGFDLVVDCSGAAPAIEEALDYIRPGGKLAVFGVSNPEARISVSPFLIFKREITIMGTLVNPFTFPKSLGLIEAMGDRYLDYKKLGIQTFELSQHKEAIQALKDGGIAKAIFKVNTRGG